MYIKRDMTDRIKQLQR